MRKIITAGALTATSVVLLMNYPTSTNQPLDQATTNAPGTSRAAPSSSAPSSSSPSSSSPSSSSPSPSAPSSSSPAPAGPSGTFTGESVFVRYGNVQVQVTVENGKLTNVEAVDYPNGDGHSAQISAYVIPILSQEAVQAQSSKIAMVSGATYTSTGYIKSLQSALDQAGL